ncbi:hypothetical protein H0H81_012308 [Sphagnurus paluster]|uniref:Uncharacterized protein n=1 Tax=Sphagnurus paluster TaxID=117069 RepID=A0A9P7K668_9AGAR|nr:hypothetical protein H0H81_012308 [Sphagnurus paluster]
MSASYIDIDYPIPTDSSEPPGSTTAAAPDEAKARVESTAFGPKQPSYLTILALDRRVRDFFIPTFLRPVCDDGQPSFREIPVELHTKRWMVFGMKEITLLNLHRPYFVHVIREMPQELARHRYAPSVISVYRSAWRLIQVMRVWWKNASYPLSRTSQPWSYVLSAAIVMCLICTRAPTSTMAPPALAELDTLLETLQEAAPKAPAAANVLVSVINLHRKAHDVMDRRDTSDTLPFDPEIERLAGKTHLLAEMNAPDSATRGPSENITLTCTPGAYFSDAQVSQLHPTLARDMRTFDVDFFLDIPTVHGGSEDGRNGNAQLHVPDVRGADSGFYLPTNDFQMYQNHPPPPNPPHEQVAPMLDSTWHSFVEQLGF